MYAAVSASATPREAKSKQSPMAVNVQTSPPLTPTAMPLSSVSPAPVTSNPTAAVITQDMNTQIHVSSASETQYELALQAVRDGDNDAALRNLSTALASGFSDWQRIDEEPLLVALASDVRFQVLRSRWKK